VGMVTATRLEGPVTGNVTGDITGNVSGVATGNIVGNVTGNITGIADGLGINYNGGWTGAGTSQINAGVVTATTFYGDGSNLDGVSSGPVSQQTIGTTYSINVTNDGSSNYTLSGTDRNGTVSGNDPTVTVEVGDTLNFVVDASGHPFYIRVSDGGANVSTPAATNQGAQSGTVSWTPNTAGTYYYQCGNHAGMIGTITVTATTTIDLSLGNLIYYTQSDDTTVSFANSENGNVYIVRVDDNSGTDRTITWPTGIGWSGGSAPTLLNNLRSTDAQVFLLVTRNMGVTWYGKEVMRSDPQTFSLWSFGGNLEGQGGQNNTIKYSSPTQIGTGNDWAVVGNGNRAMTGIDQTGAIKTDGTMWMWGSGASGILGLNDTVQRSSPTQIPGSWSTLTCGSPGATAAIKTDGTLWTWGYNFYGQLGQNVGVPWPGPNHNLGTKSSPTQVPGTTWDIVSAGPSGFVAHKTDGTIWGWGGNVSGNLGQNNTTQYFSSPTQIGTDTDWSTLEQGKGNTTALKTDGSLWSWGYGQDGGGGQNNVTAYSSPMQIGTDTTWSTFSAGYYANIATKTDGTLWTWGSNTYGKLGLNDGDQSAGRRSSPTQVGTDTDWSKAGMITRWVGFAFKNDGSVYSWGRGTYGMPGLNDQTQRSSPTQIPGSWSSITNTQWGAIMTKPQ